jgi:sec-independent protein translocase protein TatB
MFDVAPTELLVLGVVALMVIPPKDLPKAMRVAGYWVGRARGVARQFRTGFDSMVRDAELQEMEKRWADENARIMREHPSTPAMLMAPVPDHEVEDAPPVMTEHPVIASPPAAEPKPKPKARVAKASATKASATTGAKAAVTPKPAVRPRAKPQTKSKPDKIST